MTRTYYVKIEGIYCEHCRTTISSFIKKADSKSSVKISGNIARVMSAELSKQDIAGAVTRSGYITKEEWIAEDFNKWKILQVLQLFGIIAFLLLLRFLLKKILGYDILNVIPVIDERASLAAILIAGFLTSFHCVGMCGAINLAVSKTPKKALLYNCGRVWCYSAVGFFAGLVGKTFSVNQTLLGIIIILLSLFMVIFGLSMSGLFSVSFKHRAMPAGVKTSSVFITGILNGFMPCTPLITMQVYAVSTASPIKGFLSMLTFGLGTLPMMFGVSFFQNFFAQKKEILQKILATFILLLGLSMGLRGLTGLGFTGFSAKPSLNNWKVAELSADGKSQNVEISLSYDGYENFAVKKGIPVTMIINAEEDFITGCNNRIISKDFAFDKTLTAGKNEITFLPQKKGTYVYTCWMYMLKNKIYVYED
ncbi:MAG: sulfite exporter TauE/SafE family protein [Treponema sp.]|nr:sulfite exporter TauE/SafE family protein [Treponema sp.]